MCGRYTVFDEESIIEMREIIRTVEASFSVAPADVQGCFAPDGSASFDVSPIKKGELAPKDTAPVLFPLPDGSGVTPVPMRWGFPKYGDDRAVIFNARSETAGELPMFRRCLRERRVAIPSTGFFEWDHHSPGRERYLFRPARGGVLYMAGLFNLFCDGFTEYAAFVILTRPADTVVAPYHDRMPVILARESVADWVLNDRMTDLLLHRPASLTAKRY